MKQDFTNTIKGYLDYAATTPVDPKIAEEMQSYFTHKFANTASIHSLGQEAHQILNQCRSKFGEWLNADEKEIYFTSSATESNNTTIKGIAFANKNKGKHIIVSSVEHDCVLGASKWLKKFGFKVSQLQTDDQGKIDLKHLQELLSDDTILVSVMHANNEIGTLQPINKIGQICTNHQAYFHTDASQTFGKFPIDVQTSKIDLLTASSHKIYGPKGAGLLYKKNGIKIDALLHGGGHERGLRSSTVNVPIIYGFTRAAQISLESWKEEKTRLIKLRNYLIEKVLSEIDAVYLNGPRQNRLSNNINFRFDYIEGESIALMLDQDGFQVSTGSACSSNTLQPSHVLLATGLKKEETHGSIRVSLGRWTQKEHLDDFIKSLKETVTRLREMSPFKETEGK